MGEFRVSMTRLDNTSDDECRRRLRAVYDLLLQLQQRGADGEQRLGGHCSPSAGSAQTEGPEAHEDCSIWIRK